MGLNAVAFGMMGLVYGLCHWIFYTSGVRAGSAWWGERPNEDELIPEQGIGSMGALAAAISLLVMAIWHFATDPFNGTQSTMFSVVPALYGFLFLGLFWTGTQGWDWRPVGDAALWGGVTQMLLLPVAAHIGVTWDFILGLWIYGITASTFGLVILGRVSPRIHQINLILSMIVTWYYMVVGGGMWNPWNMDFMADVQNILDAQGWILFWTVLGIIDVLMLLWTYFRGPEKQFIW